jgi:hypothetical protein
MSFQQSASVRLDEGEDGSYAACKRVAPLYPNSPPDRSHNELADGQRFCVKTSEDRYGLIQVRVSEFDKVTLEVTIWAPQG